MSSRRHRVNRISRIIEIYFSSLRRKSHFDIFRNMKDTHVIGALGALAQATRLGAFRALVAAGPDGIAAGDLARALDVPPPTLSFHLRDLENAGLIASTREGRSIRYTADFEAMTALVGFLTDNCCGGKPELCAPATACPPAKSPAPRTKSAVR
jgi:DNA-binding transcriptional ArsR family regulator